MDSKAILLDADPTLRLAPHAPAALVAVAGRMIADVGRAGAGGGPFPALVPIYRGLDLTGPTASAQTFAVQLTIETGRLSP